MSPKELIDQVKAYPAEPLPLFHDDAVDRFVINGHWWTWQDAPPEAVEALRVSIPVFVLRHGFWLLRDSDVGSDVLHGRAVSVVGKDYIIWSITETEKKKAPASSRESMVTKMVGGICIECYFSNAPCGTHGL